MSILDYLKTSRSPTLLDEGLRDSLHDAIKMDLSCYNASQNKSTYCISSHALTITFSDKKLSKLGLKHGDDPYIIHRRISAMLKKYVFKCIKKISGILYVDFGEKDYRYHLHGYFNGDTAPILKLLKHCRSHFGFCKLKPIFEFDEWEKYCKKTSSGLGAIALFKA